MIIITLDIMVMVQRVTVKKTTKKKIGNRELHMDNGRKALKQQRRRRKSLLHCVTHSGVHFMVFVLFDVYSSSLCGTLVFLACCLSESTRIQIHSTIHNPQIPNSITNKNPNSITNNILSTDYGRDLRVWIFF